MMWKCLFFLLTCFIMNTQESSDITVIKTSNGVEFHCEKEWNLDNGTNINKLILRYEDLHKEFQCGSQDTFNKMLVRFRTCDNCIELGTPSLSAIIVGNILATVLIGWAVYSITGQTKGKNFSGNKASDKVNLITNGEGDTYQRLTPGQSSEYSGLSGIRKK